MNNITNASKRDIFPRVRPQGGTINFEMEERAIFFEVIESAMTIDNREQFFLWARTELQHIFPHGAMMCGMRYVGAEGEDVQHIMGCNIPQAYLKILRHPGGLANSPIFAAWIQEQQPILIGPDSGSASNMPRSAWLERFRRAGMINLAAHGQCDLNKQIASYFQFSRIPAPLTWRHAHLLRLLVPHLHVALTRVVANQSARPRKPAPQQPGLTGREKEVMEWLCDGKSNREIAQVLNISEATVKHHVHHILARLNVNTRTQAVAKTMALKLVRARLVLLLYASAELLLQGQELLGICCAAA